MRKIPVKTCIDFLQNFSHISHALVKAELNTFERNSSNFPRLLNIIHSQTNVKENTSYRLNSQYLLPSEESEPLRINQTAQALSLSANTWSPKGNLRAVLQNHPNKASPGKIKQILEIYDRDHLLNSLCVDDFHEEILNVNNEKIFFEIFYR